jgi:hypothetical protein
LCHSHLLSSGLSKNPSEVVIQSECIEGPHISAELVSIPDVNVARDPRGVYDQVSLTAAILAASIRAVVDHALVEIELDRRADVLVVYGLGDLGISRAVRPEHGFLS